LTVFQNLVVIVGPRRTLECSRWHGDASSVTAAWLWLYGPPGVGKSATGFELYRQLVARGDRIAYVELDQIGMCMHAPLLARSAAKADNLLGMLDTFAAAGADGVIVTGDIVETMGDVLNRARARPLLCRLRADDDVTLERLAIRRSLEYAMPSDAYDVYEPPAGDLEITTHPRTVREVAAAIVEQLGPWPPRRSAVDAPITPPAITDCDAILVTGPRAVGASTVAWQVLMASLDAGSPTGFLDLEQLAFLPASAETLAATIANVATCWAGFRAQGASRLVLCGHVDAVVLQALRAVLPSLRVAALAATPDTLLERARQRARHKDIWLPGDDLFGADDTYLREVVQRSSSHDLAADVRIATDGQAPADIAARITPLWRDR
jgi:hypothetical protein